MHIQRPYEEATRVNLFYNPECPLWMPGFELLILQFSKEQSFWTFTTKYVCMVSCSVQFINRFDQKYGMWPLGYKKKREESWHEITIVHSGTRPHRWRCTRSGRRPVSFGALKTWLCETLWNIQTALSVNPTQKLNNKKIINLIVWVYSINSCQKWNRIRNIFQLHCNTIEREWGTKQY